MTDERSNLDERAYMVVGEDENEDYVMFWTSDLTWAEARRTLMLDQFRNVKANWLGGWEEQGHKEH